MSIKCPACEKKFTSQAFAEAHADEVHADWRIPKQRGWATPYGFVDFQHPVTYEEACAHASKYSDVFAKLWSKA